MSDSETPTITTVEEFQRWAKERKGLNILYRGLPNEKWAVEASAHRRIRKARGRTSATPAAFPEYNTRLLERAKKQGFQHQGNRTLGDLELLAQLQHNGAATCLIDFTEAPLVALWFACADVDDEDGRVVAMATGDVNRFVEVGSKDLAPIVEIASFLGKDKLWKWRPEHLGNRIVAQQSYFVFGRGEIPGDYYESVIIDRGNKARIREELATLGVSEERLFSDFAGFCAVNAHDQDYPEATAEDYMVSAIALHQAGELEQAIAKYDRAIAIDSKYVLAFYSRGDAKAEQGDWQGAIPDYDRAIEIDSQFTAAYYNRGNAKGKLGEHQAAVADYDQAIVAYPQFAMAYCSRGDAKSKLDDMKGAIADYDRAIALDPQRAVAYYNRGTTKRATGDETGAAEDFAVAARLNPELSIPGDA